MNIRNQEEEIFGCKGMSKGHWGYPTRHFLHGALEGNINLLVEDILILVQLLVLVTTLISTLVEGGS